MNAAPSLEFDPSELNQLCGLRVLEMNPADFGGPDTPADFNDSLNDPDALEEAMDDIQDQADTLELQRLEDEEAEDADEMFSDDEDEELDETDMCSDCFTEAGDMYNDDRE